MSKSANPQKSRGGARLLRSTILSVLLSSVLFTANGCSTLPPASPRLPYGAVSRMMDMPEFQSVQSSSPEVRRWANTALQELNDLELSYELKK